MQPDPEGPRPQDRGRGSVGRSAASIVGTRPWVSAALFMVPAAHPLLIPFIGVPSHLLWWVHVLPVALITYHGGRVSGAKALLVSTTLTFVGERLLGAGYGIAADWPTTIALTVALTVTNLLVAGFALHARGLLRRYQVLFDRARIGILRTDPECKILAANPEVARILGSTPEALAGRKLTELPLWQGVPPVAVVEMGGWEGPLQTGEGVPGTGIHCVLAAIPQEAPPGHQILIVDRTTEAVQEAELERQGRLASLGEALAGVAHELNNPLAVIIASGQFVKNGGDEDAAELRDVIEDIHSQGRRMHELVQELLGYSRPIPSLEEIEVHDVLRTVLRIQEIRHRDGVRLVDRIQWEGRLHVSPGRLERIVTNLLVNAADAVTEVGGGDVELSARSENEMLIIEVADNGPGVPADRADEIFLPFVTSKPPGKGTGLGLPISRRLATSLGGTLTHRSKTSGGAIFTLILPLHARRSAGTLATGRATGWAAPQSAQGESVEP